MSKLIGIYGGTFNPVHLGHLHVARELLAKLPLTEIRFLPCYTPVHRNSPSCTPQDRVSMLKLALQNHTNMTLDTTEIDREGKSYMIDTLKKLKHDNPEATLCLIIGADAFVNLDTWKDWQSLTDYAHLIIVNRPGYQAYIGKVAEALKPLLAPSVDVLTQQSQGLVMYVVIEPSPISGSALRHAKKAGKDLAEFVPEPVRQYIDEHNLYSLLEGDR